MTTDLGRARLPPALYPQPSSPPPTSATVCPRLEILLCVWLRPAQACDLCMRSGGSQAPCPELGTWAVLLPTWPQTSAPSPGYYPLCPEPPQGGAEENSPVCAPFRPPFLEISTPQESPGGSILSTLWPGAGSYSSSGGTSDGVTSSRKNLQLLKGLS